MKHKFLTSCHRKNSVRDKVIGKKWSYLERYTLHRQRVAVSEGKRQSQGIGASWKVREAPKC